jgi:hypothetical protein
LLEAVRDPAVQQRDVPGYETELATWSGHRAGSDGVPATNLLHRRAAGVPVARSFAPGDIDADGPVRQDGALFTVLGTASDDPLSRLRAGEALSAVLLTSTTLGLATCPLSQPLEVSSARIALRDDVLGGTLSPKIVLRLGWAPAGPSLPATARRSVADIVTVEHSR